MTNDRLRFCALAIFAVLIPVATRADLYSASEAAAKEDYGRAFELYREVAELGQPEAQENLAVMYVSGEGVKRDNVLGYAWAALALENGRGEAAQKIVTQLEPHLNAAARARIAEVHEKFGKPALEERLLPKPYVFGTTADATLCKMRSAANPDTFYPDEARRQMISGTVMVEATVAPDGRARNAHAWYSVPANVFDEAGRRIAFANSYQPPKENGVAVACTIRFKVNFSVRGDNYMAAATAEQEKTLSQVKAKAESGDPRSQLTYALLLEMRPDMKVVQEPAINWTLKAAQAGLPAAQFLIGAQSLSSTRNQRKGVLWLQMAADAGQADAESALAYFWLRTGAAENFGKAQDLLEKAAASGHRDGKFCLAAVLAAGPEASRRDPKRALELLAQIKNDVDFDPTYFEIRAAAKAMLGEYAAAQAEQKEALQKARKLGWDLTDSQARLATYAASNSWTGNFFAY
jgi:TonB family protein